MTLAAWKSKNSRTTEIQTFEILERYSLTRCVSLMICPSCNYLLQFLHDMPFINSNCDISGYSCSLLVIVGQHNVKKVKHSRPIWGNEIPTKGFVWLKR